MQRFAVFHRADVSRDGDESRCRVEFRVTTLEKVLDDRVSANVGYVSSFWIL
jgi:hypothetical protein